MPSTLQVTERVRERSTPRIYFLLVDENGDALTASQLSTLTLSLYDERTGTVLNSRDAQNVLNTNNVTVYDTVQGQAPAAGADDERYNVLWQVQPGDNAVLSTKRQPVLERRRAVFRYTWASGAREDWQAVEWLVEGDRKVS
jgi:hypothetical protein